MSSSGPLRKVVAFLLLSSLNLECMAGQGGATPSRDVDGLTQELEKLIAHAKFGITLGVSLPNRSVISLAAGRASVLERARPTDLFLWGSATKMYTAAAVLRLVDQGKFGLDDVALPLMDGLFRKLNGTSLEDYFGPALRNVTVRMLLGMRAGIPDFDLRSRKYQLSHVTEDLGPVQNIGFAPRQLDYAPGSQVHYSSTNYEMLGLILAQAAGVSSWEAYDQAAAIPADVLREMPHTKFGVRGTCETYGNATVRMVHGLCSERILQIKDTFYMSCTNGWTCGNLIGNGADAATFARALLGPGERILKTATVREAEKMRPFSYGWGKGKMYYGLGLMDLSRMAGKPLGSLSFVGHGGETYGFNAVSGYLPAADAGVAIAFNDEFGQALFLLRRVIAAIERHVLGEGAEAAQPVLV